MPKINADSKNLFFYLLLFLLPSAGVGRTGVFIALDTALCQAREDNRVDIIGIINNMRYQRMKMVQTLVSWDMQFF